MSLSLFAAIGLLNACSSPERETASASPTPAAGSSVEAVAKAKEAAAKTSNSPAAGLANEPIMTEDAHETYTGSCQACHGPDGHGIAGVGSDLRKAPKRSAEEWEKFLRDPKSVDPQSAMAKPKGLDDDDYQAVAAYLADLTQNNPAPQKK